MEKEARLIKLKRKYRKVVSLYNIATDIIDIHYTGGFFIALAGLASAGLSFLFVPLALLVIYGSHVEGRKFTMLAIENDNATEYVESANIQYNKIMWFLSGLIYYGLYILPVSETVHSLILLLYVSLSMLIMPIIKNIVKRLSYKKLYTASTDSQYIGFLMLFCVDAALHYKGDISRLVMMLCVIMGFSGLINWIILKSNGVLNVIYTAMIITPLLTWLVYIKKVDGYILLIAGILIHIVSYFIGVIFLSILLRIKYRILEDIGEIKNGK